MTLKSRPTKYQKGVQRIAENDDVIDQPIQNVAKLMTVLLIADVFGKNPNDVASDVLLVRRKLWRAARSHGYRR